ncbi:hypothetical protein E3N88_14891 [Mikania micrantha]|uniref:Fe2OG dioxygenase domain-containing protein n=1 Tax=Mikania micrantha TaxID=192012 RepID=A0A5N6P4G3_9ASTR|nr:hypothetical protein E3N88_14891 [Mikania micrantha]
MKTPYFEKNFSHLSIIIKFSNPEKPSGRNKSRSVLWLAPGPVEHFDAGEDSDSVGVGGMEAIDHLNRFKIGSVPTVFYIPDFISYSDQTLLLNHIYASPASKWKVLKNRRLQNWGMLLFCCLSLNLCGKIAMKNMSKCFFFVGGVVHEKGLLPQDLPPWLTKITEKISDETSLFPSAINHVLINEYLPNQGIMPHQDGPAYFPVVAILSLGSPVVMDFRPHFSLLGSTSNIEDKNSIEEADHGNLPNYPPFSIALMPGSLLIFKDTAYSDYLHGIKDCEIQQYGEAVNATEVARHQSLNETHDEDSEKAIHRSSTRVSLTCRVVSKIPAIASMAETEAPDATINVVKVTEEIDGDQIPTRNYRFSQIGEPVPITSDEDFKFDMKSLPSSPLAVSERFGVVFVAHSSGFSVARMKDVMNAAEELKNGDQGSCIQDLSVVDVSVKNVSILALSADSSMLAVSVVSNLYFFSVDSLLNKDHEPSYSKSLSGSNGIKDLQWSPHLKDEYVVLTRDSILYRGGGKGDLDHVMDNVDAVSWSMNGKYIAVAKYDFLSILSSKFEEKLRIKLMFDSLVDDDPNCVVKVDSVRWVRPDCIMLGCFSLSADGKEENNLIQLISVEDGKITNPSSSPVALTFRDAFLAINEDDIPSGSGPYTFISYLDEFELAFVANKKNTNQHVVLFNWSENGAAMIDIEVDSWVPTISLQVHSDDDNMILGFAINKEYKDEKTIIECGEIEKKVSPCCILMCVTIDGRFCMFHFASAIGPSALPEDLNSVSDEEEVSPVLGSQLPVINIVKNEKQVKDQDLQNVKTSDQKVKVNESSGTQQEVPTAKPNNGQSLLLQKGGTFEEPLFKAPEPVNPLNKVVAAVNSVSKSANDNLNESFFGAAKELPVNKASFSSHGSSGTFSSGSLFSTNVFGVQSSASSGSFSSGGMFSSSSFAMKSLQSSHAAVQEIQHVTSLGTTQFPSGPQNFSFSKMTSGSTTSSNLLPQGASSGAAFAKSLSVVSNAQPSPTKSFDFKFSDKANLKNQTLPRLLNTEPNLSEQHSVEEMAKELDALLDSIEQPGGFYHTSVTVHKQSVAELEEGIMILSDRCQKWKDKMHQGFEEAQLLLDKTVQVLARKIYIEAIVRQATDSQYLDIWNHQKLSSELDMKRRHILEINQVFRFYFFSLFFSLNLDDTCHTNSYVCQHLTNQLIEIERHLNTLELQRFGDRSDTQINRKSSHMKHNPPRHIQSLHSLHNTMNAQLTAAEKLSECLSMQMAVLNIETEHAKKQNVKKELFDTIGISYDDTAFGSPGQEKTWSIPPKSQQIISSYSTAGSTALKKSQQSAVKSSEPETARRRINLLDKSWASIEPPKTTVKRMLLQEDRQISPSRLPLPTATPKLNSRLYERSAVSHDIPNSAINMSQMRDSLSFGIQSTPSVHLDAAKEGYNSTAGMSNRLIFPLKSDAVVVKDPKFSQQSKSMLEPSLNTATSPAFNMFQKKPIEYLDSSSKSTDGNQKPVVAETSSIWSRKSLESSAVSSSRSSTAFSGKSFSLEASMRESQFSSASLSVPVTLAPSSFSFKDTTSSSTSVISLGKSSTGLGFKLGAAQTTPLSGPSLSFPSLSSIASSTNSTLNIDLNTFKSETSKLNPGVSETSKPQVVSIPKIDAKPNESSISENQLKLNSKPDQASISPAVSSPVIADPADVDREQINGTDLTVTQEDEMEEEAPDTTQFTLGNLGGFGLGSSPNTNPSSPKQNPFGAPFGNVPASMPITFSNPPSGGLFKPASFSVEPQQPSQPPQQTSFGAMSNIFGGNNNPSSGGQGFGQPARIGSGQQALGSVLGSFGQSRQFGAGLPGSAASSPFGGGFGSQTAAGFATASSGGGGFAGLASGGGGGGFASLASGGGGGFTAAATGGFGGFSSQGSSGFSTFGSSGGTGKPPSELFTQMRK